MMKRFILAACVVLLTEVCMVRSLPDGIEKRIDEQKFPIPFFGGLSQSCSVKELVSEKQSVIDCLRKARDEEDKPKSEKIQILLDTSDCIVDKLRPTGNGGRGVNNLKSTDLLVYTKCTNECIRKFLKAPPGCLYQEFYTCLVLCVHSRLNTPVPNIIPEIDRRIPQRKRRSASPLVVFKRVEYMKCYLDCVTPTAVKGRLPPLLANFGCSVRDHVLSGRCRNLCLNKNRPKRNALANAASKVPALVNLMNSHCVSDCLVQNSSPPAGSCHLLDVEEFEYCLNKCVLKTNMLLPPKVAP